jgi:hypothetical protein
MNQGKTMLAQLMEFVPWTSFARIVMRYGGDSRVRGPLNWNLWKQD